MLIRLKGDGVTIRRPRRITIVSWVVGKPTRTCSIRVHHVDLIIAVAIECKRDGATIWRPIGIRLQAQIIRARIGQAFYVCPVGWIHQVDLHGSIGTGSGSFETGYKRDEATIRRPSRIMIKRGSIGKAVRIFPIGTCHPEIITIITCRPLRKTAELEHDGATIWRPRKTRSPYSRCLSRLTQ